MLPAPGLEHAARQHAARARTVENRPHACGMLCGNQGPGQTWSINKVGLGPHLVICEHAEGVQLHLRRKAGARVVLPGDHAGHEGAVAQPVLQRRLVRPVRALPARARGRRLLHSPGCPETLLARGPPGGPMWGPQADRVWSYPIEPAARLIFFTCGWSARMPVSNTPMRTPAPRNPAAHSRSAPNSAVTLLRAASRRRAVPATPPASLALPRSSSSSRPSVGRVHSLRVGARADAPAGRAQCAHHERKQVGAQPPAAAGRCCRSIIRRAASCRPRRDRACATHSLHTINSTTGACVCHRTARQPWRSFKPPGGVPRCCASKHSRSPCHLLTLKGHA